MIFSSYGTAAALIFPKIFFSTVNPHAAAIASLATFGVAYVARPFGAVFFGHIGDKWPQKGPNLHPALNGSFDITSAACPPMIRQAFLLRCSWSWRGCCRASLPPVNRLAPIR